MLQCDILAVQQEQKTVEQRLFMTDYCLIYSPSTVQYVVLPECRHTRAQLECNPLYMSGNLTVSVGAGVQDDARTPRRKANTHRHNVDRPMEGISSMCQADRKE